MGFSSGIEGIKASTYYVGAHFVVAQGTLDKIIGLQFDGKWGWQGESGGGDIIVNNDQLFGGLTREGGVAGTVTFLSGLPTQARHPYLQSLLGTAIPAFRGVSSLVFQSFYWGLNYYLKSVAVLGVRIHQLRSGAPQWQDALAEVPSSSFIGYAITAGDYSQQTVEGFLGLSYVGGFATDRPHGLNAGDIVSIVGCLPAAYNGDFIVLSNDLSATHFAVRLLSDPGGPVVTLGTIQGQKTYLINAVHVLRECMTDISFGLGITEALLDDASWIAAATTCYNEGLGFSWEYKDDVPIKDFMSDVMAHIQADIWYERLDQTYHIRLKRVLTSTAGLPVLNQTHIASITNLAKKGLHDLVSTVVIKYQSNFTFRQASYTITNPALVTRQGGAIEKTITYSGVATPDVAQKLAIRDLRQLGTPVFSCTIKCNRIAENWHKGTAFVVNHPIFKNTPITFYVVNLNLGTLTDNMITIEAIQDFYQASNVLYHPPVIHRWINPISGPTKVTKLTVYELPYYFLVKEKGESFANAVEAGTSYMACSAVAPVGDATNAFLYTSLTSSYVNRGGFDFCFYSELASSVSITGTTLTLTTTAGISDLTVGRAIQVGNELMGVVSIVSHSVTVKRGVCDTVPTTHAAGTAVFGVQDEFYSDAISYLTGEVVNTKITALFSRGESSLTGATVTSLPIVDRIHAPYPPGNVKVNGTAFPSEIAGTLVITWAHRSRLIQTGELVDHTAGNIGPEPKTTYTLRLYDQSNLLARTVTNIPGTSYTWSTEVADSGHGSLNSSLRVELEANKEGIASYQSYSISLTRTGSLTGTDTFIDPPTSFAGASDGVGAKWTWNSTHAGVYTFDLIISSVNNRNSSLAETVTGITALNYTKSADSGTFYAWVRAVDGGKVSDWVPSGTTAGISSTVPDLSQQLANAIGTVSP